MGPSYELLSPRTLHAKTGAYPGMPPKPIDGVVNLPSVPANIIPALVCVSGGSPTTVPLSTLHPPLLKGFRIQYKSFIPLIFYSSQFILLILHSCEHLQSGSVCCDYCDV